MRAAVGEIRRRSHRSASPASAGSVPMRGVAAIVTCHNYGRYLGQCLGSVLAQTVPFREVVVVDDASGDETAAVARGYAARGVQYLRVEHRNVNPTRNAGLAATTSPLVVHIDADNWLAPTYLAEILPAMDDNHVAIASSAPWVTDGAGALIDLAYWGRTPYDYWHLRRENHMDACSIVRRDAVEQAGGWSCPVPVLEDWHLWLRVTRAGWRAVRAPGTWFYRAHDDRVSARHRVGDQDRRVAVMRDVYHVAVAMPFSGREFSRERVLGNLERLGWDPSRLHLIAVDNSCDPGFGRRLRRGIERRCASWGSVCIVNDQTRAIQEATNAELSDSAVLRMSSPAMVDAMSRIYARTIARLLGQGVDLVLTIEDDIEIIGDSVLPRLIEGLHPDVMAVSGVVHSRYDRISGRPAVIAADCDSEYPYRQHLISDAELERGERWRAVAGTGMGCLLSRGEMWDRCMPLRTSVNDDGECRWHDITIAADVRRRFGMRWLLDASVECRHWQEGGGYV